MLCLSCPNQLRIKVRVSVSCLYASTSSLKPFLFLPFAIPLLVLYKDCYNYRLFFRENVSLLAILHQPLNSPQIRVCGFVYFGHGYPSSPSFLNPIFLFDFFAFKSDRLRPSREFLQVRIEGEQVVFGGRGLGAENAVNNIKTSLRE